jgi:Na+-transporting NADH:ubiquinone oxidoreductase subunit C
VSEHKKETVARTLIVALVLCVVCSAVVAAAAVALKPKQQAAKENDRNINILQIAGIYEPGRPIARQMEQVKAKVIDFETGRFTNVLTPEQAVDVKKLTKNPKLSERLDSERDIAKLIRREKYGIVYLVEKNGQLDRVILPIRGYGLWSTLWGFIALESDLNTVAGFGYYQHAETPGLGGEVDNPNWKAQWIGKQLYRDGELALHVLKGKSDSSGANAVHEVDGLAGATLTTKGVNNMVQYWLGDQGYGKFLKNLKAGDA